MTIPDEGIYPLSAEVESDASPVEVIRRATRIIDHNFRILSQAAIGTLRNYGDPNPLGWTPTVGGTSTVGAGTYSKQVGWVQRQGIFVDVWFDVSWSAHTGTGNLFLDLPYLVTLSTGAPFVGVIQASSLTYTGGYVIINAIPNTRRGEIATCASATASSNVAMDTSAYIRGHVRYVGQREERT